MPRPKQNLTETPKKPPRAMSVVAPVEKEASLVPTAQDMMSELWENENLGDSSLFGSLIDHDAPPGKITRTSSHGVLLLLRNKPTLYRSFLGLILSGVHLRDACGSIGLAYTVAQRLLLQGRESYYKGVDHWCSRFYSDVLKARSQARGLAQMTVKKTKPLDWLKSDADYRGFSEQVNAGIQQLEMAVDAIEDPDDPDNNIEGSVTDPNVIKEVFAALGRVSALPSPSILVEDALAQEGHHASQDREDSPQG